MPHSSNTNLRQYSEFNSAGSVYSHGAECDVRIYSLMDCKSKSYLLKRGHSITNLNTFSGGMFQHGIGSNKWVC